MSDRQERIRKEIRCAVVAGDFGEWIAAEPGTCALCANEHTKSEPHNLFSMFYRLRFRQVHGRDPTSEDAVAHLSWWRRRFWRVVVKKYGYEWTTAEAPISEPFEMATTKVDMEH